MVEDNELKFTSEEAKRASCTRVLSRKLGHSTNRKLTEWINRSLILNCLVTLRDARRAELINRPDMFKLRGKSVRSKQLANMAPTNLLAYFILIQMQNQRSMLRQITANVSK